MEPNDAEKAKIDRAAQDILNKINEREKKGTAGPGSAVGPEIASMLMELRAAIYSAVPVHIKPYVGSTHYTSVRKYVHTYLVGQVVLDGGKGLKQLLNVAGDPTAVGDVRSLVSAMIIREAMDTNMDPNKVKDICVNNPLTFTVLMDAALDTCRALWPERGI